MFQRLIQVASVAVFTVLALAGCSTIPKISSPSGVDVSVVPLTTVQVRTYYGTNAQGDPNPFIPPGGLLTRQTQDYVVVRIEIAAAKEAEITVGGMTAEDAAGKVVAEAFSWEQFKANLQSWYQPGRDSQIRYNRARNAYLPGKVMQLKPGRWDYIVVLVGKHPMPHPVAVKIAVAVNAAQPKTYEFEANPVGTGGVLF